jgi:colanic acid/amylovoran biosynthesis glycosyltransferase
MKARPGREKSVFFILPTVEPFMLAEMSELAGRGWSVRVCSLEELAMWREITGGRLPRGVERCRAPSADWHRMPAPMLVAASAKRLWKVILRNPSRFLSAALESRAAGSLRYFLSGAEAASVLLPRVPDRIHSHFAWDAAYTGMWAAKLLGVPFSLVVHSRDVFVPGSVEKVGIMLDASAPPMTASTYNIAVIGNGWGERIASRVVCIHPGVDTASLPARRKELTPQLVLCAASGLAEKKGVPVLLDACEILARRRAGWRCVIAGSDDDGTLLVRYRALVERRGLGGIVEMPGLLRYPDLLQMEASASVFVLPCVRGADGDMDGLPISLMEAMGVGLPVVSTRISGIPELIEDGVSGILTSPGDAGGLADGIFAMLDERGKAEEMGDAARERIGREFGLRGHVDLLERAWRSGGGKGEVRPA